jgi:putative ABC transport system permease protein
MTSVWQDVRYGLRVLLKNPGFTLIATLTLALAIGANTALFSVVNGVLLNPLPFPRPDELVVAYSRSPTFQQGSVSYANFLDWRKENRSFALLSALRADDYNMIGAGEPERVHVHMVSSEFFTTLGLSPQLGRSFAPEEDRAGAAPVTVLGDGLWKRRFGSSPGALGRSVTLNGTSYAIIGVAPGRVAGISPTDLYIPIGQWTDPSFQDRRISMGTNVIGRLKSGVGIVQARADMDRVAEGLAAAYPEADKGMGIALVPLKDDVVGNVKGILLVLQGAVGFVLLIACANVANLLLARSTGRAREFAIRTALGAGPARVVRQLLTESVLLGVAGGALGLLLARPGVRVLLATLASDLPRSEEIALDGRVLAFTLGVSVLTGVVFGLVPALKSLSPRVQETLKEGGRGGSGTRHRAQQAFIVLEMAMAVVLLIGGGLMMRTLASLGRVDPGFDPRDVLTFSISATSGSASTADQLRAMYRETLRRLASIEGVEAVSLLGGSLPMNGDSEIPFWIEGQPRPAHDNDMPQALFYLVNSGYHRAMRIPLERGRAFTEQDDERAPAVALIDERFARQYFPNQDPVGKRLNIALLETQPEIVGVVGHVEHWGLGSREHENLQAQIYFPVFQVPDRFWPLLANGGQFVARTIGPAGDITRAIREGAGSVVSSAVVFDVRPMEEIVSRSIATQRLVMLLLGVFSALALVLSAVGTYGVISYLTGQRTHEIGVRVALGASGRNILGIVLGQGLRIALIGVAAGLAGAFGLTRLITSWIYGVRATDPLTFGAVAVLLSGVALFACYIPARRAMRVDPIAALRQE